MDNRLPDSWCVENDDSQLFKETVVDYLNSKYYAGYDGNFHGWYGVLNNNVCTSYNSFGTTLTIKEFMELIGNNTKVIIGWKLKEEYSKYESAISSFISDKEWWGKYASNNLKNKGWHFIESELSGVKIDLIKAGVFDLWFEPVYENELLFKDGDIILIEECGINTKYLKGNFVEIMNETNRDKITAGKTDGKYVVEFEGEIWGINIIKARLATQEELIINSVRIKGYSPKFDKTEKTISFGCQSFSRQDIESYMKLFNREINGSIVIGSANIDYNTLRTLYKLFEI